MKKTFFILAVALVAFTAGALTVWLGTLVTVNNTTAYSNTNSINPYATQPGTFQVTNTGLTATNALTVNLQESFDDTNFFTVASFNPPQTNAGTYPWTPGPLNLPVYQRIQIVTTNSVMLGIFQ